MINNSNNINGLMQEIKITIKNKSYHHFLVQKNNKNINLTPKKETTINIYMKKKITSLKPTTKIKLK